MGVTFVGFSDPNMGIPLLDERLTFAFMGDTMLRQYEDIIAEKNKLIASLEKEVCA